MKNLAQKNNRGFTIIELMVTVAVIAILCAIAIPNFLGFQNKAKRKLMSEVAASAKTELHHWIEAAAYRQQGVIDVDGNGIITAGEGHTNLMTVPSSWIQAFAAKIGETPLSPWNGTKDLFTVAPLVPVVTGQVVISRMNGGKGIEIRAYDVNGNILYQDSVSVE